MSPARTSRRSPTTSRGAAENVGVGFQRLPEGWKAEVKEKDGNLFERVETDASVRTTWLLTPPTPRPSGR
ncbi:NEW3 domain-containing protein [Streptomyces tendae]|uniref:NEW3 domain-containing protein n=1 Tax=Streptomyces tendae TaxID=1932 RepID=UPI002492A9DC|nr:NEW3 domain-containing protein [Streptomyces tendae]